MPRTEPSRRKHRTAALKNLAQAAGGASVAYAGIRVGRAAKAVEKSTPSHIAKVARNKVRSFLGKIHLDVRAGLIRFAKPGEMSRKYAPDSPFVTEPIGRQLFKGATARKQSRMRPNYTYPKAKENFDKRAMREADIHTNLEGAHTEHLEKIKALTQKHQSWKKLGRYADVEGAKMVNGKLRLPSVSPAQYEKMIVAGKNHPLGDILHEKRRYAKELQSNVHGSKWLGYNATLNRKRTNIRRAMADEFVDRAALQKGKFQSRGNREILQGYRKSRGTLPRPLTSKEWEGIKSQPVAIQFPKSTDPNYKWQHGIESATTDAAGSIHVSGKQKIGRDVYKEGLVGWKKKLSDIVATRRESATKSSAQMEAALTQRARGRIQTIRTGATESIAKGQKNLVDAMKTGKVAAVKAVKPRKYKLPPYSEAALQTEVRKTVNPLKSSMSISDMNEAPLRTIKSKSPGQLPIHLPSNDPISPGDIGARTERIANRLGLPARTIPKIQDRFQKLGIFTQSHAGEQAMRHQILREGKFFAPPAAAKAVAAPIVAEGFPTLKRLGKIGGIAAGGLTAGLIAKKIYDRRRKQPPQHNFSQPGEPRDPSRNIYQKRYREYFVNTVYPGIAGGFAGHILAGGRGARVGAATLAGIGLGSRIALRHKINKLENEGKHVKSDFLGTAPGFGLTGAALGTAAGAIKASRSPAVQKAGQKFVDWRRFRNAKPANARMITQVPKLLTEFSAKTKLLSDSTKRRIIEGLALTGGIAAADAATSGAYPDPDKTRGQSALAGAKRGTLYGGVLAGVENRLRGPFRKVLFSKKDDDGDLRRDIAVGGVEGGAGILATDRLIKRFAPEGSPLRRKVLIGAGIGGLATGTIGYGLNRIWKRRQQQQQMSARAKLHEFRISRSNTQVLSDGSKIDIQALNRLVQDRAATRVKMNSLKPMAYTKKSGYSERRVKNANTQKPILVHRGDVVDGRHRITKKQRLGHTTASAIKVTQKDLNAVKLHSLLSCIYFDTQSRPPRRHLIVAQDRYRKQIRDREIQRHESNLARAAVAGGALSKVLGHKFVPGALAGAATEAAVITANRRHKDAFGDSPISVKREERLPYQAAGLTAGGILAHKLTKRFRLSARGQSIQFERQKRWDDRTLPEKLTTNPKKAHEELVVKARRGFRLARDLREPKKTLTTVKDERGRERRAEWSKPWAVGGLALAGGALILGRHQGEEALAGALRKYKPFEKSHPTLRWARVKGQRLVDKAGHERNRLVQKIIGTAPKVVSPAEALAKKAKETEAAAAEAERSRQYFKNITTGKFSSKGKLVQFGETVPDWDIRDARGRSARVYAPGSQKRNRREKKWHEKKANRDLLAYGIAALGTSGGASAPFLWQRFKNRNAPPIRPIHVAGTGIHGVVSGGKIAAVARKLPHDPWIPLNSLLDNLIQLEEPIGVEQTLKRILEKNRPGVDYRDFAKNRLAALKRTPGKTNLSLLDYLRGQKPSTTKP